MEKDFVPVFSFKCPVCHTINDYKPKKIGIYNFVCPKCQVKKIPLGSTNPFNRDKNDFNYECAEKLILGGDINSIIEELKKKYPKKNEDRIKASLIEISRKMTNYKFARQYDGKYIKMTKIVEVESVEFEEDVTCPNCGDRNSMIFSAKQKK